MNSKKYYNNIGSLPRPTRLHVARGQGLRQAGGRLKASKIGVWRIKQSDLDTFLEQTSNIDENGKKNKKL